MSLPVVCPRRDADLAVALSRHLLLDELDHGLVFGGADSMATVADAVFDGRNQSDGHLDA